MNRKQNLTQFSNEWVDRIIETNKKNWIFRWMEKRRISKELDKVAPSVEYMKNMIETIDMLSILFFYDNNPKKSPIASEHINSKYQKSSGGIFLNVSKSIDSEQVNCLIINISEYTRIRILIDNQKVKTLVENQKGEIRCHYEWFIENPNDVIKDKYDELFFINMENEIMNRFKELVLNSIK